MSGAPDPAFHGPPGNILSRGMFQASWHQVHIFAHPMLINGQIYVFQSCYSICVKNVLIPWNGIKGMVPIGHDSVLAALVSIARRDRARRGAIMPHGRLIRKKERKRQC
jgi:hypothetical protein